MGEIEYLVEYLDGDTILTEWATEEGLKWLREEGYEIRCVYGE